MSLATSTPAAPAMEARVTWLRVLLCSLPLLLAITMMPAAESPFSIPKRTLLIVVAYGVFFFAAAAGRLCRVDRAAASVLAAIPLAALLAWAASTRRDLAAQTVLMICAGPLLAWVVASVLRDSRRKLLVVIAVSGVVEALVAVAQWGLGLDLFRIIGRSAGVAGRMRVYGTMGNPDFLAIYIAATLPVLLALASRANERARWVTWAAIVLDVVALGGAGSRTGIVAAMCGCAAVLLFDADRGLRRARTVIVFCAIAAATATALAWRNPRTAGTAARGRVFTWRVSLVDAAHRPFGDGPGTFAYLHPAKLSKFVRGRQPGEWQRFIGYERTANNDFVQAIAETGWPGLAALASVFLFVIIRLRRAASQADALAVGPLGIVTAIGAAAMAESPLQRAETWALLWLCVGLAIAPISGGEGAPHGKTRALRFALAVLLTAVAAWFALRPIQATYWADAGAVLESQHRYPDAVAAYRRSVAYDPSASSAPFNLPRALVHAGEVDAALAAANDGLRWIDEPELRLLRLRILETRGGYIDAFRQAAIDVDRFPYSLELLQEYAQLASRLHSW